MPNFNTPTTVRALAILIVSLSFNSTAEAQDAETIQARIDSLSATRSALQSSLQKVDSDIDSLSSLLQQEEIESGKGIPLYASFSGLIRTKKNALGEIVARISRGTKLIGVERDDSYWRVRYNGKEGYFPAKHIESEEERDEQNATAKTRREAVEKGFGLFLKRQRSDINSAGGVDVSFWVENIGTKEIKYVTFYVAPYNAVGDRLKGRISGRSIFDLKAVGPIVAGQDGPYLFDAVFYAGTTSCIELRKIVVEHRDGSSFVYANDLQHIRHPDSDVKLSGECRRQ